MYIEQFGLERWFGKHEHGADIMLAESGIRPLASSDFDTDPGELNYVIPTDGDPEFRAEVAERYGRGENEVCFTCGTQEANLLVFLSLLSEDDHVVVVTPTYQALHAVPDAVGDVTRVSLTEGDWRLDVDAVAEAMREETRLVVLNNPNNPTGRYHSEEKVRELYDLAAENDAYLLCDEVYRLLADEPIPPVASMGEYGISTTSLTKAYGLAGLRFGWIAGPEDVVQDAVEWKDYTTISPPIFGQHVARQALGEREDEILTENRELAESNRDIVREFVEAHDLDWFDPIGVNGFISVPDGFVDGREFCTAVVEQESVVLAPGDLFGYDQYWRIGFGLPTDELEEGLERVARVVESAEN
ncbi:aminotransferase class I/II-fold pyridoxal phosphate-dependent enzyme [Haloarchaeobius sp. TZWWS8]|uniref:aminotransferase class I/II-fold pyridoxal phosphate-dependent enzyme n=1 Tax=Haloarchaeobius sp. TZWWS8 TaxID=3446121 RepID=UPI003EC133D4